MRLTRTQVGVLDGWLSRLCSFDPSSCLRIGAAFAAIYLIWGSTYLAIRLAIETMPPFFMAGLRFITAGTFLYTWTRLRGAAQPTRLHWRDAAILGGLMLLGGNGGVTWAEQRVPSGLAALLIATVPLWMALLDWARPGGVRPTGKVAIGLALGLVGITVLIGPGKLAEGQRVDGLGAVILLGAALAWSIGSLYSRRACLPAVSLQGAAIEMLAGGALLWLVAGISGEWGRFNGGPVSARSLIALGYLIVFGSIVAFTAYLWLLRATTPARAATYAYVNPVVAMFLGWAAADEPLNAQTLLATVIIVAAVVIITVSRSREQKVAAS